MLLKIRFSSEDKNSHLKFVFNFVIKRSENNTSYCLFELETRDFSLLKSQPKIF